MAGEWFAVDCCLESKPETAEILVATGEPVDAVVGRLVRLWAWAQLNSEDGSLRGTPAVLAHVAGGDEAFWLAVEATGWIEFDGKLVKIAGWDKRFSQAAKKRMLDARRKAEERKVAKSSAPVQQKSASCPKPVRSDADKKRTGCGLEEKREEEKRIKDKSDTPTPIRAPAQDQQKSSSSSDFASDDPRECWEAFRARWKAEKRAAPLGTLENAIDPPRAYLDLWRGGDSQAALDALGQLSDCRYFEKPLSLAQFLNVWPKIAVGGYREPRGSAKKPDDKPTPERWLDKYQPSDYKRPREAMARDLATTLTLKEG